MRIMLDSMIHDKIVDDPALIRLVDAALVAGKLTLVSTHVQKDELSRIPDDQKDKRDAALAIPVERRSTAGAIWDVSSWDEAHWGDDADDQLIAHVKNGNPVHGEDALIAATAAKAADTLVTNDSRLRNRIRSSGSKLQVWTFEEFTRWLRSLT